MEDINKVLFKLSKSKFRSSFKLRKYMIDYINEKGMDIVKSHTVDFIKEKLQPLNPKNDGKQTPMKGHPTFIAMHACGCCCRSCLEKWHHIEKERELTKDECNYIYKLLITWIEYNYKKEINHID